MLHTGSTTPLSAASRAAETGHLGAGSVSRVVCRVYIQRIYVSLSLCIMWIPGNDLVLERFSGLRERGGLGGGRRVRMTLHAFTQYTTYFRPSF